VLERLLEWTAPARDVLGLDVDLPATNGTQRAREVVAGGGSISDAYRSAVEETRRTYLQEGAVRC
jgi:hypothetical protein